MVVTPLLFFFLCNSYGQILIVYLGGGIRKLGEQKKKFLESPVFVVHREVIRVVIIQINAHSICFCCIAIYLITSNEHNRVSFYVTRLVCVWCIWTVPSSLLNKILIYKSNIRFYLQVNKSCMCWPKHQIDPTAIILCIIQLGQQSMFHSMHALYPPSSPLWRYLSHSYPNVQYPTDNDHQ